MTMRHERFLNLIFMSNNEKTSKEYSETWPIAIGILLLYVIGFIIIIGLGIALS